MLVSKSNEKDVELVAKFDALEYPFKSQLVDVTKLPLFEYLEDKSIVILNLFVEPEFV